MVKKKKQRHWAIWTAILILTFFIIYQNWPEKEVEEIEQEGNELVNLMEVLTSETNLGEEANCLTYATYYNETISKLNYVWGYDYDIRFPRYVKFAPNITHTFLIVAGGRDFNSGEPTYTQCILDQHTYICLNAKTGEVYTNG